MKILRTFFEEHKEFNVANLYNDDYWYYNEYRWKQKEYYKINSNWGNL